MLQNGGEKVLAMACFVAIRCSVCGVVRLECCRVGRKGKQHYNEQSHSTLVAGAMQW